jgi:hypothetical protein
MDWTKAIDSSRIMLMVRYRVNIKFRIRSMAGLG